MDDQKKTRKKKWSFKHYFWFVVLCIIFYFGSYIIWSRLGAYVKFETDTGVKITEFRFVDPPITPYNPFAGGQFSWHFRKYTEQILSIIYKPLIRLDCTFFFFCHVFTLGYNDYEEIFLDELYGGDSKSIGKIKMDSMLWLKDSQATIDKKDTMIGQQDLSDEKTEKTPVDFEIKDDSGKD